MHLCVNYYFLLQNDAHHNYWIRPGGSCIIAGWGLYMQLGAVTVRCVPTAGGGVIDK